jgi:hypothetical protein
MDTDQLVAISQNGQHSPLGLPKGSIRALIALAIFGSLLATLVFRITVPEDSFWFLWMLNYAILAYYFAIRQNVPCPPLSALNVTVDTKSVDVPKPLGLPRGSVRWIILLAFFLSCGILIYRWFTQREPFWEDRAFFPMLSLCGFFVGRLLEYIYRKRKGPLSPILRTFQNIKSAFALVCALSIILIIPLEIPVPASPQVVRFSILFIFFYFGSR